MQTAQIELKSAGLIAEITALLGGQMRAAMKNMVLQARIKQERRQLLDMPDYLLKDIGVTREQAIKEAMSPVMPERSCQI